MQVLHEKRKGVQSSFYPYLQELPPHFDMPLQWSKQELDELHYPCLKVMVCLALAVVSQVACFLGTLAASDSLQLWIYACQTACSTSHIY